MIRNLLVVAAVAAAGVAAGAAPASAGCYGTANTVVVCSTLNAKGTLYEDCVYTGSGACTPVSVPGPAGCVSAGGSFWTTSDYCF